MHYACGGALYFFAPEIIGTGRLQKNTKKGRPPIITAIAGKPLWGFCATVASTFVMQDSFISVAVLMAKYFNYNCNRVTLVQVLESHSHQYLRPSLIRFGAVEDGMSHKAQP